MLITLKKGHSLRKATASNQQRKAQSRGTPQQTLKERQKPETTLLLLAAQHRLTTPVPVQGLD